MVIRRKLQFIINVFFRIRPKDTNTVAFGPGGAGCAFGKPYDPVPFVSNSVAIAPAPRTAV
jgi:hypothetical protein